jgi:hypothetical protein
MILSVSRLYGIDDNMINEYRAVCGMRIGSRWEAEARTGDFLCPDNYIT